MTRKENIRAILECYFTGFKDVMIDSACERICELEQEPTAEKSVQDMTELEKALLHIKTRADAWAVKVVKDALSQEPTVTSTDEPMTMVYPTIVCDDAVSRDALKKMLIGLDKWHIKNKQFVNVGLLYDDVFFGIEQLPSVNPQPCDDAVSRQAVLDTEYQIKDINGVEYVMLSEVQMKMRKLPSVEPICEEREKGECPWYAG